MNFIFPTIKIKIERWKFNPEYQIYVSTYGNLKDKNKKPIKPKFLKNDHSGYMVIFYGDNRFICVHRLVMMTWRPIADFEKMTVDHLNHNKRDNSLENLEWVTRDENWKRAKEDFAQEKVNTVPLSAKKVKMTSVAENEFEIVNDIGIAAKLIYQRMNANNQQQTSLKRIREKIKASCNSGKNRYGYKFEYIYV